MASKKKIGKKFSALLITGLVFILISSLHLLGVFQFLEYKSYDMRVRFWANTTFSSPSHDIIVILLDQDSLDWAQAERGWGWPWPRQAYAEIIDYMNLGGANAVAFDVIFSEPSIYRNVRQDEIINNVVINLETGAADTGAVIDALISLSAREDDEFFINASLNSGNVVQVVMFSSQTGNAASWPSGLNSPLFQPENFGTMLDRFSVGENERAQFPIQGLRDSASVLGSVTGIPDSDGIIRRIRPFTLFDGKAVPGLSSALLMAGGKGQNTNYNSRTGSMEWEEITIPLDRDGNALLRYRGLLNVYNPYRAMDILLSAESTALGQNLDFGRYLTDMGTEWNMLTPDNFSNTYVFFGFYAQGLFDIFSTPVSSVYAGMGCHITMLDNMLNGDFIRESSQWLNLIILLVLVTLVVYLSMFSNKISLSIGGMLIIVIIVVAGAFLAYEFGGLWLPMITGIAGVLAAFITVTIYNYATEGSQKRFIKSAFSQYLSPKVIEQIILDPSQLKLGGEKREMTALFTDLRAFSTFSEALGDPAKLVELLNFYLTRMCDIVLDNQGTIDKYVGDAIIGFWGAPIHMDDHAILACRSAVYMKKLEKEMNREVMDNGILNQKVLDALAAKGKLGIVDGEPRPLYTRLGLNTGDMVVGNMGTPNKMNYTIMGNAVNLASRLEGVNDQYNTFGIIISEYTRPHVGNEFVLRPLSRVRVVGINTPVRLYELMDIASEAPPALIEMVKNWEQAFKLYESKEFSAAKNMFESIYSKNNDDLVAKKYLGRCENYISTPPEDKIWDDGVDNLSSK